MMDRREFLLGMGVGIFTAPVAAGAPQAAKVARVGVILTLAPEQPQMRALIDPLRQGLLERGHVEGRNIAFEYRWGSLAEFPALAVELVRLKVDLIVVGSTTAALAAKQATKTIPIVAAVMADPVRDGLVPSLAQPDGNVTGLTFLAPELVPKRLELLKEAIPSVSRVAGLWNPGAYGERTMQEMVKQAEGAAQTLRVQLDLVGVGSPDDFASAFSTMTQKRVDAFVVLPSPLLFTGRKRIVELAARHRLPGMYQASEFVELGGLIAYGASIPDLFRRSATYVDRILKGAKPGDLPVEQATKFELVINLKTAKALGLTIPPSLLLRADQVIE
jgi:putative tryptophan/tyrosine transport system substrate-binding protein